MDIFIISTSIILWLACGIVVYATVENEFRAAGLRFKLGLFALATIIGPVLVLARFVRKAIR